MKLYWLTISLAGFSFAKADDNGESEGDCKLWLAPSSLSTSSTVEYGLFAGVEFSKDDIIPDVELAIPYIDFFLDSNRETEYTKTVLGYLEHQMWASEYSSSMFEGNVSTSPFVGGLGTIANYHALVSNAQWLKASSFLREREDITEPGKPHLSRGAITNVYNLTMVATERIPVGMEIFPNFGDLWDSEEPSTFQDKITRKDIYDADKVLDRIVDFYDQYESQMTEDLKEDMLDFMLEKILGVAAGARSAVILSLIPQNYRKIRQAKEAGGTFLYRFRDSIKKTKWLEENGICVDTMYPAKSTIAAAGRGAFASRDIAKGDTITVVPTVLFGSRDLMKMYDVVTTTVEEEDGSTKMKHDFNRDLPRGQQIGLNYAFGHPESSFLFLPASPMVHYINHKSTPNAKLQWSTHSTMGYDKATWDHTVEEVMLFKSNMVVFEIEATQDIKKGDEIFLHYGNEWIEAWTSYEDQWKKKHKNKPWPLRAEDVKITFKDKPFPTDSTTGSLPPGVAFGCFIKSEQVPDGSASLTEDGTPIQQWTGPVIYQDFGGSILTMCELKDRRDDGLGSYNYTVVANVNLDGEYTYSQVNDVPHSAITVVDSPYAGDIHTPDAFRHFIGIPNKIFPQNWRDLR